MVDPYDWLGLSKAQRPPTHYQLLGLDPAVTDAATIRSATDRRFRNILPHLTGPEALEAERIWNELEEARDTLLDPKRRAHYDATLPAEVPRPSQSEAPVAPQEVLDPAPAESPLSPEELAAASLPDPNPWWKSTPEAPSKPEPWWRESAPDAPGPPPPVAAAQAQTAAATTTAPRPAPPSHTPPASSPRKRLPVAVLLIGLVVAGGVVAGIYFGFGRKHSPPTTGEQPVVEGPKTDHKPKPSDSGPAGKPEEPVPETPLPKTFADQLRPKTFSGHSGAVNALAVAASGSRFVSVGTDKTLRLWSIVKGDSIVRHTFVSPAVGVSWYRQDRRIAAADGLTLGLFDPASTTSSRGLDSPRSGVTCVAITPDGSRALTGLSDGFVRLWDTGTGRFDEWAVAARGPITAVDVSTDGSKALVAVAEGAVSLWNLAGRNRVHEWTPHNGGAISVRFSPDTTRAATSGSDGAAAIFDLATHKETCRLDGHVGPVTGVAWLPDGWQVVTVAADGLARLWAADTGQPLRWSQALDGKGSCVAVDPGGRFALAGTSTGTIHLLPLPRVKPEAVTGPPGKPPANPMPIPDSDAVAAATAGVRTDLAREFGYNRPDDMALLADNLRRRAAVERALPALRFGLLQEARSLATRAGDPITAFQAIEDLAAWFDVDELAEKATTFAALPAEVDGPGLLAVGLTAAERAELDARPEIVERLLKRLPESPPAGTPPDRSARLTALRRRAAIAAAEWKAVRQALDVLKNAPDDQASNQVVGVYLCFARQDWTSGLPMLVKGTDPRLIEAAKFDVSTPTDPKARHNVGELWFKLAVDQKDHRARRALLGRARTWFEREAKSKLDVSDAVKARARLDDIARLDVPGKDPTTLPLLTPFHLRRAYNTLGPDVRAHEWRLTGGAEGRADGVALPDGSPVLSSRFGLGPGGRLALAIRPDGREVRINCAGQEFAFAGSGKTVQVAIERAEGTVTVTATGDEAEPISRTADLPTTARGPLLITLRMTGAPARPGGAQVISAIVRGPVSLPLPLVE